MAKHIILVRETTVRERRFEVDTDMRYRDWATRAFDLVERRAEHPDKVPELPGETITRDVRYTVSEGSRAVEQTREMKDE